MTVLAQLVASNRDSCDYTTYVFKCLEKDVYTRYVMCTRWPNWDHRQIKLGEIGYLEFEEIKAGVNTWYNGNEMIPYKYNNIQFLKFIEKPEELDYNYVM